MRLIILLIAIPLIHGCSTAAWGENQYGKQGTGFVGSAYGYEDVKISETSFFVSYKGMTATNSVSGFHRRAKELCESIGLTSYDVAQVPGMSAGSDSVGGEVAFSGGVGNFSSTLDQISAYVNCK